jgi:two-component system nitrate/nitrite response regulator NarL
MRSPYDPVDPLRVCVLADDAIARAGLTGLLAADGLTVASARLTTDLDDALDEHAADVLLIDPGADPSRAAAWLDSARRCAAPAVALLVDATRLEDVFALGVVGALARDASPAAIRAALAAAAAGLVVIDAGFHRGRAAPVGERRSVEPMDSLTPREVEVLALLATGMANKVIAHHLGISEHTAKFHVTAVMAKLGATSRTDAVIRAARRGMVSL